MTPDSPQQTNSDDYLINPNDLANWLRRNSSRQQAVIAHLFISIATLRSWWMKRRNIPKQYHAPLAQMMAGNIPIVVIVSPEALGQIQKKAVEKGFTGPPEFLSDLIERIF